jgi:hypothetical protein
MERRGRLSGKKALKFTLNRVDQALSRSGIRLVRSSAVADAVLHQYPSTEDYKRTQIRYNLEKFERVWADEDSLQAVVSQVLDRSAPCATPVGLCHGTRNGWEQDYLRELLGFPVWGTDISPTAQRHKDSFTWDFHDERPEWNGRFCFVYSNSLDQSRDPKQAITTWLNQLCLQGELFVELTRGHSPTQSGPMDPFGVRHQVFPYLLARWFGHSVSVSVREGVKKNYGNDYWLFCVKKQSPLTVSDWDFTTAVDLAGPRDFFS